MSETPPPPTAATKNGVLAGVISTALFSVAYTINKELFLNLILWWGTLAVYLFFMYRSVQTDAELSFREKVRDPFVTFVVANGIFYFYFYFMMAHFDPSLQEMQLDLLRESNEMPEGTDPNKLTVSLSGIFFQYARSLIMGFGLAAALTFLKDRLG